MASAAAVKNPSLMAWPSMSGRSAISTWWPRLSHSLAAWSSSRATASSGSRPSKVGVSTAIRNRVALGPSITPTDGYAASGPVRSVAARNAALSRTLRLMQCSTTRAAKPGASGQAGVLLRFDGL